ncbi:hypothetical protein CIK05_11305 [Bdellovibrio sp. qaytius]|nr:hypothetical protein CIK05_11305 [Bdellovibrio sp. qaytius]
MITKFLSVALVSLFAQVSLANTQTMKSGFIYSMPRFDSCSAMVTTFNNDKVVSLKWVNNPISGYACPSDVTQTENTFKCEGSRCVALQAFYVGSKNYYYFVISETGNFYLNTIECTPDSNGLPTQCKNPGTGPEYYSATTFQSEVTPTLFQGYSYYLPGNDLVPAQDRKSAIAKASAQAQFDCARFWNVCKRDFSLDQFSPTPIEGGEYVTIYFRGR